MIHQVLPIVVSELNEFLKRTFLENTDRVVISELVDTSGVPAAATQNKVVCLVTNITPENADLSSRSKRPALKKPPLYLNLSLLFAANFPGNYLEGLALLSRVLSFFNGKQVFTPQNTPGLPTGVEKVVIEIDPLDQQTQSQLWLALGATMKPSISIKLRMLAISQDQIREVIPEIIGIDVDTEPTT